MKMTDLQSYPCISLYCVTWSANNDGTCSFPYCSCNVIVINMHFLFPFCCIEKYVTKQLAEISYIRISYFTHIMGISVMNLATLKLTACSWIILEYLIFSQKVKLPAFYGTVSHVQYSQAAICIWSQMNPVHTLLLCSLISILVSTYHLCQVTFSTVRQQSVSGVRRIQCTPFSYILWDPI